MSSDDRAGRRLGARGRLSSTSGSTWRRRTAAVAAGGGALLLAAAIALLRGGFQTLAPAPYPLPPQRVTTWEEVLARPAPVTLEVLVTGTVDGDRFVVLDESDPNLAAMGDRRAPTAVLAYWVHHRTEGDYLIDAGLARAFADGDGNYTTLLRLVLAVIGAENHQASGMDAASQLGSRGVVPRAVFLTHLHGDHTSGLADLPAGAAAVFGRGEDTFLQKAMMGDHLHGRRVYALSFDEAQAVPPFDRALDLLGDGSIWALSTRGHSPSHVSYLVNAESGPVLIAGDAAAYEAQLEHGVRPNAGVDDQPAAIRSLARLRSLRERFPQLSIMAGHEPPRAP